MRRGGLPGNGLDRLKAPERERRELHRASDSLRNASAPSAQAELDLRPNQPRVADFAHVAAFSATYI
jgi:hypothetical protein